MPKIPTALERIYETAEMRLPGALRPVVKDELFMVLDEFFRKSMCWVEQVHFAARMNVRDYDIAPTMGRIIYLHSVYSEQDRLLFQPASVVGPNEIELIRDPTREETLVASVSLTLTDPTTRDGDPFVPLTILEEYRNTIVEGLLARMMSQPAKPYTNFSVSQMHNVRFVSGCSRARIKTVNQSVPTRQSWRFPNGVSWR